MFTIFLLIYTNLYLITIISLSINVSLVDWFLIMQQSVWSEDAFDIAKQFNISKFQSTSKSLEQSTTHKLMLAMLDGDERFVDPTPISFQNLTLQSVKDAVLNQLNGSNMKVDV